jgi:iron complex outermembrane receptor protein
MKYLYFTASSDSIGSKSIKKLHELKVRAEMGHAVAWLALAVALCSDPVLLAFDGKVIRTDGAPVAEATVSIVGHTGFSRTDAYGRFSWSPDPPCPFEALIVLPGGQYVAPVWIEEIPADGPLVITVAPMISESVTVTASATPNIETTPASGMNVVSQETMSTTHPVRLTGVVENVPGSGRLSDLHAAVPSLRGLARGRTLILIDGARVTTERRAGASATYLDPFFLDGVEISRGPGSVAYGSDAFGGIIHARTRQPEPDTPLHIRFHGSLGAGLPEKSGGVEISRGFTQGGWVFQARHRDFDEYWSPKGEVFNSAASDSGFLARMSNELGRGVFTVGWQSDFGRDVGRPTIRSRETRVAYPREDSHRLTLSFDADPFWGFTRVDLRGFWGYNNLVTDREKLPNDTTVRSIQRADVSAQDFGFRGLVVRPLGGARVELGVDINGRYNLEALSSLLAFSREDDWVATTDEIAIEQARRTDAAVYASTEILLGPRLTGSGGIRFDRVTTRNHGGFFGNLATSNGSLSGFGSLKVEISPGLSLTGQVSRGFRDPMLSDRYYRGISGRGLVTGNPALEPERSLQFDTAFRYARKGLRCAFYAYQYRIENLIERFEDGADLFYFRNHGRARLRGVELEIQWTLLGGYTFEIGAQTARGKALEDNSWLDDVPVENLTLKLRRDLGGGNYIDVRTAFFGRDERPGPTETVTPGFWTLDIGGGWKLNPHLQIRFLGRNLLNESYPVSPDRRAVLAPGRSGVVTLVAEL